MGTLTIRNLPEDVKTRLRLSAAANGHSMEEEARAILRRVLTTKQSKAGGLGQRIHARFAKLGGVELETPKRRDRARAPRFAR
jgi:plasmid stability protein